MNELNHYRFTISCDSCGGSLKENSNGGWGTKERKADVECTTCKAQWFIKLDMVRIGGKSPVPTGVRN